MFSLKMPTNTIIPIKTRTLVTLLVALHQALRLEYKDMYKGDVEGRKVDLAKRDKNVTIKRANAVTSKN